jgi:hypothetical protein
MGEIMCIWLLAVALLVTFNTGTHTYEEVRENFDEYKTSEHIQRKFKMYSGMTQEEKDAFDKQHPYHLI